MENKDLMRRAEDLALRCDKMNTVTNTLFLTPAEQYGIHSWGQRYSPECRIIYKGGKDECERRIAFFLPYYIPEEDLNLSEYICAVKVTAGFGMPNHRDYMGAVLGLGIKREWIGDIWVMESTAYIFCMPSVVELITRDLEKVGRFGVKTSLISLDEIPSPERKVVKVSFSVMSFRLDAIVAGMFSVSRTEAARLISAGDVFLNYNQCLKSDTGIKECDIISIRGRGKGQITGLGGTSRRGRQFVNAEIFK